MESADVAEARRVLRDLLARAEAGELDAPALLLARLTGAHDALVAITDPGPTTAEMDST